MTVPSLPINSLIQGSYTIEPTAAQAQNTNAGLILGSSNVINATERYRKYTTPAAVASDFGSGAPETLAAQEYFAQKPQPGAVLIGRWLATAASGQLVGAPLTSAQSAIAAWQAITSGGVDFTIDGTARNLATLDFSGCYNLNAVAGVIQTALSTHGTFVYSANSNGFILSSSTTGTGSTVSFATTGAGTDISALLGMTSTSSGAYIAQGAAAESAISAVQLFDSTIGQKFYGLAVLGAVDADHIAIANYIESSVNKHSYWITTSEGGCLVPSDTSDIMYVLSHVAGLDHSFTQYSSSSPYAAISSMAKAINIDYSGTNTASILMYKTNPGVSPENINATQLGSIQTKNGNVFVEYDNNTAILQPGVMASGQFADTILGADAFFIDCQNAAYNALYTNPTKIPQTDAGMGIFQNAFTAVCQKYVTNGFIAQGVWDNPGFGALAQGQFMPSGFYVYAPPVASQSSPDRAARKSVTFQIAAKLAGGVQTVLFAITINL